MKLWHFCTFYAILNESHSEMHAAPFLFSLSPSKMGKESQNNCIAYSHYKIEKKSLDELSPASNLGPMLMRTKHALQSHCWRNGEKYSKKCFNHCG